MPSKISKLFSTIIIFSCMIFSQDSPSENAEAYIMMLGSPISVGITPKSGIFGMTFSQNQMQTFIGDKGVSKYTKGTISLLLKSGIEFKIGQYLKSNKEGASNLSIDVMGLNYHIKKKKYGIGLHFTTYKHNLPDLFRSRARETGISIHKRFKKKSKKPRTFLKPFIYYSRLLTYPAETNLFTPSELELFSFGCFAEVNHLVIGTYVTAEIEDILNLNKKSGQFNIILGVTLY